MKKLIARSWQIFKATPLGRLIRFLAPQWLVNLLEHLPIAFLSNMIYGFPSNRIKVIGVTGTDGKTTTVNMIYQVLKSAGKKVSMVSTINAAIGDRLLDTGFHISSPHSFTIQEFIKQSVDVGSEYLILEVTSHALDQHRFSGTKFLVGVITNITHEHLDYHKTFENYKNTKLKLLENVKWAVVNANLEISRSVRNGINVLSFGLTKGYFNQENIKFNLKIPGDYNIENALAAMAVADILGIDQKRTRQTLENFTGLTGRMEEIENGRGLKIVIDFAHTPNGLENALGALRSRGTPWRPGRVIAIIGCEGYRDVGKRSMMGEIAGKMADFVVVTSVDPRGQLEGINKQIIHGLEKVGAEKDQKFFVINDRKKAIYFAINNLAEKGDTIGIFGKGHETSMNLDGKKEAPWSDKKTILEVLNG